MNHPLTDEEKEALAAYLDADSGMLNAEGTKLVMGDNVKLGVGMKSDTRKVLRLRLVQYLWEFSNYQPARFAVVCGLPMQRARSLIRQFALNILPFSPQQRLDMAMNLLLPKVEEGLNLEDLTEELKVTAFQSVRLLRENLGNFESLGELVTITRTAVTLTRLLEGKPTAHTKTDHSKTANKDDAAVDAELEETRRQLCLIENNGESG